MPNRTETLHYLLMSDHLMVQKALVARVKDTGLTPGQPKVLDYLSRHDGTIQREIATSCHIEPASLTALLSGMEAKGYIERKNVANDRRSLAVYLTDKGRAYAGRLDEEFAHIEAQALEGFSPEESAQLQELLSRVYCNMTEYRKREDTKA